ncbi:MAG: hypothetical protein KKF77_03500 [Proteobacteria bacterium]|nr:hypothetical protein [Pseudomonadota bacterium]
MYTRIVDGLTTTPTESLPVLGPKECALVVECCAEVQAGWPFVGGEIVEPGPDAVMEAAILDIVASYDLKRKGLKDRMAVALLQDGENEAAIRAALAAEWQQANADEELEIFSLLGG